MIYLDYHLSFPLTFEYICTWPSQFTGYQRKGQSDKMIKVSNYKHKLLMAQDRSENRMIMIMMIIIMLLCFLFLNNSQGACISTIYPAPHKGPVRYLCKYWKYWSPEKSSVWPKDTKPSGQNWDSCLPVFWIGLAACCLQWANKQGEGGSTECISCVNDHPWLFCLLKAIERRAAKVKGPEGNCWSHQMSDLPGSYPSVSQSKLPNLSPSLICTPESGTTITLASCLAPLSPPSPTSTMSPSLVYYVSWISPKCYRFFPPPFFYWAMIISPLNNWSPCLALSDHLLSTPTTQGIFYKCTFLYFYCSV